MSLPVVLRDEAIAEFDEAFDCHESQKPGLGVDFVARVQQVFDRIAALPQLHAAVFADVRKAVPDEAGLLLERLQHPVASLVSDILEAARLDLVRCHPKVFHDACSSCSR